MRFAYLVGFAAAQERYNILSLDSAKYKGILTANMIEYMEQKAYMTAIRDECIDERESGKIAMPELFDMIAGSETGAIIGSSLLIKNDDAATSGEQPNKYFAEKSKEFFT